MNLKDKIGYFLFVASLIIGYSLPLIFTIYYSILFDEKWPIRAGLAYGLSWFLFGLFILMNGRKAYINIKNFVLKKVKNLTNDRK